MTSRPGWYRDSWTLLEETDGDILIVGHRALNVVLLSHLLRRPLDSAFGIKQDYLRRQP